MIVFNCLQLIDGSKEPLNLTVEKDDESPNIRLSFGDSNFKETYIVNKKILKDSIKLVENAKSVTKINEEDSW